MSIPQLDTTFLKSNIISSLLFFFIFFIILKIFLQSSIDNILHEMKTLKDTKNYIHQLEIDNHREQIIHQDLNKNIYAINEEIKYLSHEYCQEQVEESRNEKLKVINEELKSMALKIKNNEDVTNILFNKNKD